VELSNYYQGRYQNSKSTSSERFPGNHVKFSPLLRPLRWVDSAYGVFGYRAFSLMKAMLKEFDRIAPLDEYIGTRNELNQIRNVVALFCKSIDNNPYLSPFSRFLLKKLSLNLLKNRNRALQYYHSNKEFINANGEVKAPVIITGLPRSGTTLLHRLMSEDPNTRSPYTFEMEIPIPPMTLESNPLDDPRIKSSQDVVGRLSRLASGFMEKFAESHYWSATEREESLLYMLAHNGLHVMNSLTAGKAYLDALVETNDKRPIFRYERLFFTMLDAYRPVKSHWTLKTPVYALFFPNIFEEYPDARVVVTHRNPLVALPSNCRLMESWCIAFDEDGTFDKHQFAKLVRKFIKNFVMVPFHYRKEHSERDGQIIDCIYAELFSEPIATVKSVYQKFGLEYTEEFEQRMKVYLANNKQGKYGRHKYSLEEYELKAESIYQEYRNYMEHFGFGISDIKERPFA
jgi:hypothetical protein